MRKRKSNDPARVEELVKEHYGLAVHLASDYARRYPRVVLQDLTQECLAALTRAAQSYKPRRVGPPFPAFALLCIRQACWRHVNRHGWPRPEVSLSEPAGDDLTVSDIAERRLALAEARAEPGADRHASRLADLRELAEKLDTLTDFERKLLRLLYVEGIELQDVCGILGRSHTTVSTAHASAIRKMRSRLGLPDTGRAANYRGGGDTRPPRFNAGLHARHHRKKRNPLCPFCNPKLAA